MLEEQDVRPKIVIVGAGNIGGEIAVNLMRTALHEQRNLDIVVINRTEDKAKGIVKDITSAYRVDTRGKLNPATLTATEEGEGLRDADVVIFTAGIRAGLVGAEDRNTLLPFNVGIALTTAANIKEYAPNSFVIVFTNPDGILTTVMQQETGFPAERVIGTGVTLDSKRFEEALYHRLVEHVPHPQIGRIKAHIIGYHNKGEMVLHHDSLRINDMPLEAFQNVSGLAPEIMDGIIRQAEEDISNAGFEIVRLKGGEGAHIAPAAIAENIALAWIYGKEKAFTASVSMVLTSENRRLYSLDAIIEDIPVGVIAYIRQKNITINRTISLSEEEKDKVHKGAEEMYKVAGNKTHFIQRITTDALVMRAAAEDRLRAVETQERELLTARIATLQTQNELLASLSANYSSPETVTPKAAVKRFQTGANQPGTAVLRIDTPSYLAHSNHKGQKITIPLEPQIPTYSAEEGSLFIKVIIHSSTPLSQTTRKNYLKELFNNIVPDSTMRATYLKSQQAKISEHDSMLVLPKNSIIKQRLTEHNIDIKPSSLAR